MTSFLAFSGSTRQDSFNSKLAAALAAEISNLGENAEVVNLKDFDMPIYDGDLEAASGLPSGALALKAKLDAADGLIISCPEYNGYMAPVLINAIDWCTRSNEGTPDLGCFMNKPIFIAGASPGPGGGGRVVTHLKTMLSGIGAYVSPFPLTLPAAYSAYNEAGELVDAGMKERANKMMVGFIQFTQKLG